MRLLIAAPLLLCCVQGSAGETRNVHARATATFAVREIACLACAARIEERLTELKGIDDVEVDVDHKTVTVVFDASRIDEAKIAAAVAELGFTPRRLAHPVSPRHVPAAAGRTP